MKYNYYELIELIKEVSLLHPFVKNFFTNKYALNNVDNIDYGVIALTVNSISVNPRVTTYSFNLLYADRLTQDRDNTLEVQSAGIDTLIEIINALLWNFQVDITTNYTINVFKNQFADECAGAVATINITSPSEFGECAWLDIDEVCCFKEFSKHSC